MSKKLVLCIPNGFCAGVDRAIKMVELALEAYGTPIYVHHEIVHNQKVVDDLAAKGVIFVNHIDEVPKGNRLIFSAHGVSPAIRASASEKKLKTLDATCPLVTKVHLEALRFARKGYHIFLIGHEDHVEVKGTYGEAPEHITIIEPGDPDTMEKTVAGLIEPKTEKLVFLTQTTLSVNDCQTAVLALRNRFPHLQQPPKDDICYATTNRQNAVKFASTRVDFFVVIGSPNSSNSRRLVEVALDSGVLADLFPDESHLEKVDWNKYSRVGITAGASTPAILISRIIATLESYGYQRENDLVFAQEDTIFSIPAQLKNDLAVKGITC